MTKFLCFLTLSLQGHGLEGKESWSPFPVPVCDPLLFPLPFLDSGALFPYSPRERSKLKTRSSSGCHPTSCLGFWLLGLDTFKPQSKDCMQGRRDQSEWHPQVTQGASGMPMLYHIAIDSLLGLQWSQAPRATGHYNEQSRIRRPAQCW